MASTVDQIVARFRRRYPDCPEDRAAELFRDAHRRLLSRVQVRNDVQTISLVEGQAEYDLPSGIFKIHSAYFEGEDRSFPVLERSVDELDVLHFGWRTYTETGDPTEYYITSQTSGDSAANAIGFLPIPRETTGVTYPRVVLHCTSYAELSGSETVPENLLSENFYLYDMYAKWCAEAHAEQSEFWEAKAERELHLNHEHVMNIQTHGTVGIIPAAAFVATAVI